MARITKGVKAPGTSLLVVQPVISDISKSEINRVTLDNMKEVSVSVHKQVAEADTMLERMIAFTKQMASEITESKK